MNKKYTPSRTFPGLMFEVNLVVTLKSETSYPQDTSIRPVEIHFRNKGKVRDNDLEAMESKNRMRSFLWH